MIRTYETHRMFVDRLRSPSLSRQSSANPNHGLQSRSWGLPLINGLLLRPFDERYGKRYVAVEDSWRDKNQPQSSWNFPYTKPSIGRRCASPHIEHHSTSGYRRNPNKLYVLHRLQNTKDRIQISMDWIQTRGSFMASSPTANETRLRILTRTSTSVVERDTLRAAAVLARVSRALRHAVPYDIGLRSSVIGNVCATVASGVRKS